ncbi:transposase, partial [Gluconobacter cerinus]|uniref:transposase n=1 Tax=Gluconobacter cerinus TaxID=38307 RepID=UPI0031FEDF2D
MLRENSSRLLITPYYPNSGLGDQLEAFSRTVDFEAFRPDLEQALAYSDGSNGGRPPFDPVLMFKILVIQTLNNLSD